MIGEKVKIELAARLIGAPDRRLQNRKWAKTDAMTSAFAHYHREIIHFKRLQNFRKCIFFCSKHYVCSKFVNKHHFLNKKFGCLENVH